MAGCLLLGLVASTLVASCADPSGGPGVPDSNNAVIGALVEAPLPSAVGLMNARGTLFCSGSLISPRVVLTAAHCLVQDGITRWPYAVFIGADVRRGGTFLRVQGGSIHPAYDDFLHTADLALLRLAGDETTLTPLALAGVSPALGDEVQFAGFGESTEGPSDYQHVGSAAITFVGVDYFRYTPGTCRGDSGGPVLTTGSAGKRLIGVASMSDLTCTNSRAVDLDHYGSWVTDSLTALDPPACRSGDGRCGEQCPFGDTDCACVEDGQCRLCAGSDPDCADACAADGFCAQDCLAPDPDCHTGVEGATCVDDVDCESSVCAWGRCRSRCGRAEDAACAPWQGCTVVRTDRAVCLSRGPVVGGCSVADQPFAPAIITALFGACLLARGRRARACLFAVVRQTTSQIRKERSQ